MFLERSPGLEPGVIPHLIEVLLPISPATLRLVAAVRVARTSTGYEPAVLLLNYTAIIK